MANPASRRGFEPPRPKFKRTEVSSVTTRYNWPTREEWKKQQRTPYYDLFEDLPVSKELKNYATPEEIAAAVAELKEIYRVEGCKMRDAKRLAGPLAQQPGETGRDYCGRVLAMADAEQQIAHEVGLHREVRRVINKTLRTMGEGYLPSGGWIPEETRAPLATIKARYDAALKAAEEVRPREIEATPIDDAAWEEELRRRASIEKGSFIIG
jgi:hypothetical protein